MACSITIMNPVDNQLKTFESEELLNVYILENQEIFNKALGINTATSPEDLAKTLAFEGLIIEKNNLSFKDQAPSDKVLEEQGVLDDENFFFSNIANPMNVSLVTYEKLVAFAKKINPDFQIRENMEESSAEIGNFIINLKTNQKFSRISEEAAHFFVELLPKEGNLYKSLIGNINNYEIYKQTYEAYKSNSEYQKDGRPDIDKIKREAAAKLIAEYISAMDRQDYTRVNALTKVKDSFINKWISKFLSWFGITMAKNLVYYKQSASDILYNNIDELVDLNNLNLEELKKNKFYHLKMSVLTQYANEINENRTILTSLPKVIRNLNRHINNIINLIDKNAKEGRKDNKLNLLEKNLTFRAGINDLKPIRAAVTELNKTIDEFDLKDSFTDKQLSKILETLTPQQIKNYLQGTVDFLRLLDYLDNYTNAILNSVRDIKINKVVDPESEVDLKDALEDITQLKFYRDTIDQFKEIFNEEFIQQLEKFKKEDKSNVEMVDDIISIVDKINVNVDAINRSISERNQDRLYSYIKSFLSKPNSVVLEKLLKEQEVILNTKGFQTPTGELTKAGKKEYERVMSDINRLVVTDEGIKDFLRNDGRDMTSFQTFYMFLHDMEKNGDQYIAGVSRDIIMSLNNSEQVVREKILNLNEELSPLEQELRNYGLTQDQINEMISFDDVYYFNDKDNKDPDKKFLVYTLLNEFKDYNYEINKRLEAMRDAEDRSLVPQMRKDLENYKRERFHGQFTQVYYKELSKFFNDPFFLEVQEMRTKLKKDINAIEQEIQILNEQAVVNLDYVKDLLSEKAQIELKRKRMSYLYYEDGTEKPEGSEDRKIALLLQDYFETRKKFREPDHIATLENFESAKYFFIKRESARLYAYNLTSEEERIVDKLKEVNDAITRDEIIDYLLNANDEKYTGSLKRWEEENQEWQFSKFGEEYRDELFAELEQLIPKDDIVNLKLLEINKSLQNIRYGKKDTKGQYDPEYYGITPDQQAYIRDLEKEQIKYKRVFNLFGHLSEEDIDNDEDKRKYREAKDIIEKYVDVIASENVFLITEDENDLIIDAKRVAAELKERYTNVLRIQRIRDLFARLGQMTETIATSHYFDFYLSDLFLNEFSEYTKEQLANIDANTSLEAADKIRLTNFHKNQESSLYKALIDKNTESLDIFVNQHFNKNFWRRYVEFETKLLPSFSEWLKQKQSYSGSFILDWMDTNHLFKDRFIPEAKGYVENLERTSIWNKYQPNQSLEDDGYVLKKPLVKFNKDKIREEYVTKEIVGETVDNMGGYLPLPTTTEFRNEKFFNLKNSVDPKDKALFKYLETIKATYLKSQDLITNIPQRMWMQIPRRQLDAYESKLKFAQQAIPRTVEAWRTLQGKFSTKDPNDPQGFTPSNVRAQWEIDNVLEQRDYDVYLQRLHNDNIKIGLSSLLPRERVSNNILGAVQEFMVRAEAWSAKSQKQPVLQALISTLESNPNSINNKNRITNFKTMQDHLITEKLPTEGFLGVLNDPMLRDITQKISGLTALRLMVDTFGATVNFFSAEMNNLLEVFAKKHYNMKNYKDGTKDMFRISRSLVGDYNNKNDMSFESLFFLAIDPIVGESTEKLIDKTSLRAKLFSIRQLAMIPRTSGEIVQQGRVAMARLRSVKVKNSIDQKEYTPIEMYEKVGNKLVLKEGFNKKEWEITISENGQITSGTRLKQETAYIRALNHDLHGTYNKQNASQISRYGILSLAENMKKWFVDGVSRRWHGKRVNLSYEDITEGFHLVNAKAFWNVFKNVLKFDFKAAGGWMEKYSKTPRELAAIKQSYAEMSFILLLALLMMGLGYAGPDRNKKVKENAKNGFPGWLQNAAILVAMRLHSETSTYIPLPGLGYDEMKLNLTDPFKIPASTIGNVTADIKLGIYQIADLFGIDMDDKLYYQRNTGKWLAEKGDYKLLMSIAKTFGYNSSTLQPDTYIVMFDNIQGKLKQ